VALVLDVSGSVGAVNVEKIKLFAKSFIDRMALGDTNSVGLLYFGSNATVASPLTATAADLTDAIAKVVFEKDSTNTAQALALARGLFEERGSSSAKPVVVVVTDGMPESAFLTGVEVGRLKEQGIRLVFVPVGKSVSQHVLRRWASWPWEENVVPAAEFGELEDTKVTEVLANICGEALA